MPQLDVGTFRGQVTWVRRVFIVLYRTRTGDILPKLNRIVKMRAKKRERTRGDATQYDGERARVERGYSGRLGKAAGGSYGLLQERGDAQTAWVNKEVNARNQSPKRGRGIGSYRGYRMGVKVSDMYLDKTRTEMGEKEDTKGKKVKANKGKSEPKVKVEPKGREKGKLSSTDPKKAKPKKEKKEKK
jgi:hypothetical protein